MTEQEVHEAIHRILHLLERNQKHMSDLTAATAQTTATLAVMAQAALQLQSDVTALAAAHAADDSAAIADLVAKLKVGTDALAAGFPVAQAAAASVAPAPTV